MANLIVVEQLQDFLVAQKVAQLPGSEPSLTLPSIWTQPRQGAPLPREQDGTFLEEATITLNDAHLSGPPGLEPWLEDTFIDVLVRSRGVNAGKLLHRTIRGLLTPVGERVGRKNWTMGQIRVLYTMPWRQEQALPASDDRVYDRVASFRFCCARSDLAA